LELSATAVEIAFEAYRTQLAGLGVKKNKLPPRLRIPRPTTAKKAKPVRRQATVDEVRQVLSSAFQKR
jgi:hypothetical protein